MREDPATHPLPVGGRAAEEVGTVDGPTQPYVAIHPPSTL